MEDQELFVDHSPRRARALRWCRRRALPAAARHGRKMIVPVIVTGAMFSGIVYSAHHNPTGASGGTAQTAATLDGIVPIDYQEECVGEGCSNEEVKELWNSFKSECLDHTCYAEEAYELSGGPHYNDDPYNWQGTLVKMLDLFRTKLGKQFTNPRVKNGNTNTAWTFLYQLLDGRVIKTPKWSCDPACG